MGYSPVSLYPFLPEFLGLGICNDGIGLLILISDLRLYAY